MIINKDFLEKSGFGPNAQRVIEDLGLYDLPEEAIRSITLADDGSYVRGVLGLLIALINSTVSYNDDGTVQSTLDRIGHEKTIYKWIDGKIAGHEQFSAGDKSLGDATVIRTADSIVTETPYKITEQFLKDSVLTHQTQRTKEGQLRQKTSFFYNGEGQVAIEIVETYDEEGELASLLSVEHLYVSGWLRTTRKMLYSNSSIRSFLVPDLILPRKNKEEKTEFFPV